MKNKILIAIILILLPMAIYKYCSFSSPETIFNIPKEEPTITINYQNNLLYFPLEKYVYYVVAAEMPASFQDEALKAQAIASRTFTLHILNSKSILSTSDQAFNTDEELQNKWQSNYEKYQSKILNAVAATKSIIMTYNNEPIASYYYAMSNGYTEDSASVFNETYPYLGVVSSPEDNSSLPQFTTSTTISKTVFCNILNIDCSNILISNIKYTASNRVYSLEINSQEYLGTNIRKKLNLRSTAFTIKIIDDTIIITCSGYGHGVGMSQYGANGMAKEGLSYADILNHYYQNIKITSLNV